YACRYNMFNISPFFFTVWMVHGRYLVVNLDDADLVEEEIPVAGKLPGICWACKWALNKVKKAAGNNATAEVSKVCDQIGFLKSLCRKFVKKNLSVLIEELSTTDDVRTICVNLKACKPKEDLTWFADEDINMYQEFETE
uniref:NK-lysin tandem duplicate 4 n=1 Tax=Myripristis murdjan TaxID=586833 RepID=A0A667WXC7_9TELE